MSQKINVMVGGVARKTAQSAQLEGAEVRPVFDPVGRQLTRPYQVRGLISTAAASLTTGTKAVLTAGVSGAYLDLIQIGFYNNSDAATVVTLLDESTIVRTFPVPANSLTQTNLQIPIPQNAKGVGWYLDMPDITGTTIETYAEFLQEV